MARLARVVIPGHPHHVTQRGNGRARTFFDDADYALYRNLLAEHCRAAEVEVWGWCLMPNHVHLILVPSDSDGLRRALARVHRAYAGVIQARRKRSGHFCVTVTVHLIDSVQCRWHDAVWPVSPASSSPVIRTT
jgi:putative transposase